MMILSLLAAIEDESDREFMTELYITYHRLMFSEVMKITHNEHHSEDIVQTSVEKLIGKISLLRTLPQRQLINYIISTVKNTTYNYLKKELKQDILYLDELSPGLSSSDSFSRDIEQDIILKDEIMSLSRVWDQLDSRSRYLLEAKYILEKTAAEIAKDLDIKPDSVRMALVRARQTAYKYLMKEHNPGGV